MLDPKAGHTQGKLLRLAAEFLVSICLTAVYILVGGFLCVFGCGIFKYLVKSCTGLFPFTVFASRLIWILYLFCHRDYGTMKLSL